MLCKTKFYEVLIKEVGITSLSDKSLWKKAHFYPGEKSIIKDAAGFSKEPR